MTYPHQGECISVCLYHSDDNDECDCEDDDDLVARIKLSGEARRRDNPKVYPLDDPSWPNRPKAAWA